MMFTCLRWRDWRSGSLPALLSALNLRGKLLVDFKDYPDSAPWRTSFTAPLLQCRKAARAAS